MPDLRIAWTQSADDPTLGGDVDAYEIAREGNPNPVFVVASVSASAALDDTLYTERLQSGVYHYRVRARNSAGRRSLWSNEAVIEITTDDPIVRIVPVFRTFRVKKENRAFRVKKENRAFRVKKENRTFRVLPRRAM